MTRPSGRRPDDLRELAIEPDYLEQASGSALISFGKTRVLCTASLEEGVPRWLAGKGRGWLTAEYSMLPASTGQRTQREASAGKQKGRTVEIQRLIGRALRAVADMDALGERTLWLDCDVLQADGGTRCASISGVYVAAKRALDHVGLGRALDGLARCRLVVHRRLGDLLPLGERQLSHRVARGRRHVLVVHRIGRGRRVLARVVKALQMAELVDEGVLEVGDRLAGAHRRG